MHEIVSAMNPGPDNDTYIHTFDVGTEPKIIPVPWDRITAVWINGNKLTVIIKKGVEPESLTESP